MKKTTILTVAGLTVLIGVAWLVLALVEGAGWLTLAPLMGLSLLVLGVVGLLLRGAPGRPAAGQGAWLPTALVFGGGWLLLLLGQQWLKLAAPGSGGERALSDPAPSFFLATVLGLPAVFGALGLISGYRSGQARTGLYAGLVAGSASLAQGSGLGGFFAVMSVLYASLGGVLGAYAAQRRPATDAGRAARRWGVDTLALAAVGLAAFAALGVPGIWPDSGPVGTSLAAMLRSDGFVAWALILLLVLVVVQRATRASAPRG